VVYTGNGVTTAFAVAFAFHAAADLVVIETIIATGVQTVKTITTHYTVSGTQDAQGHFPNGGTVTAVVAPASTVTWTIYRDPAITQLVDLVENDPLPVEAAVESPLDRLTMIAQRIRELVNRSMRQPDGDAADINALPAKVTRASKYLAFDATGDPVATAGTSSVVVVSTFIETLLDDTTAAAARTTLGAVGLTGDETIAGNKTFSGTVVVGEPKAALEAVPLRDIAGYIFGLTLSNNAGDATNDIDIAAGVAVDSTSAYAMLLASAVGKRLDAAWAVGGTPGATLGGLDTGAVGNNTYHVWLIARSDTGVVDVLFSLSATAPTMPTNYNFKRRIGSIVRVGGVIKAFVQDGDYFQWLAMVADISATNPGSGASIDRILTVPTGIRVRAVVNVGISAAADMTTVGYLSDKSVTDEAASALGIGQVTVSGVTGGSGATAMADIFTNTSATIRSRVSFSDANVTLTIKTRGWIDTRGRLA
jgi:hypothetical protein